MRKIILLLFSIAALFSCTRENIVEEIVSKHEDGSKKEVFYHKVDKDGNKTCIRETWYYMEGMKHLDGPIADGKRNGKFETYYKSGNLMSTGEFLDGTRVGKATTYHENGAVKYEGMYENGKECGIWKFYDENGNLLKEVNRDLR